MYMRNKRSKHGLKLYFILQTTQYTVHIFLRIAINILTMLGKYAGLPKA